MKQFHALSFGTGLLSGAVLLVIGIGGVRLLYGPANQQLPAGRMMMNMEGGGDMTARMAERMGMTEEELQEELDSGKTMEEIATERGVALQAGGRFTNRSSASGSNALTASGSAPLINDSSVSPIPSVD